MIKAFYVVLLLLTVLLVVACQRASEGANEGSEIPAVEGEGSSAEGEQMPTSEAQMPTEATSEPTAAASGGQPTEPAAEVAPTSGSLTLEQLANAEYLSQWVEGGKVQLTDGFYRAPQAEDAASELVVTLSEVKAFGDLNADGLEDAAIILVTNAGGSGTFYEVAAIVNQDGTPHQIGSQFLGDRIELQSVAIEEGNIVVQMKTHSADDPFCCPTVQTTQRYQVQGEQLAQLLPDEQPAQPVESAESSTVRSSLTLKTLANAEYRSEWADSGKIKLTDGLYEAPDEEGAASKLLIRLANMIAFGDLNGDGSEDAVVVLMSEPGASGTFYELAVVLNENGEPNNVATEFLGDRLSLKGISITKGEITVKALTDGSSSQEITQRYQLQGELLAKLPTEGEPLAAASADNSASEGFMIKKSTLVPVSTIWQAADPMMMTDKLQLKPEEVYLNVSGLATSLQGSIQPAVPYDPNQPPNPNGHPEHLRIAFDNEALPASLSGQQRQLLIYPVAAYRAIYQAQGNHEIARIIDTLKGLLSDNPPALQGELPFLPPLGASQVFGAQLKALSFQNGTGLRYITHYAQDANPITNEALFYTFQGLTNDGQYYISLIYPISTASLPNSYEDSPWSNDDDAFMALYDSYLQETTQGLNRLPPADFTPNLEQLDGMIQSLMVGSQ